MVTIKHIANPLNDIHNDFLDNISAVPSGVGRITKTQGEESVYFKA